MLSIESHVGASVFKYASPPTSIVMIGPEALLGPGPNGGGLPPSSPTYNPWVYYVVIALGVAVLAAVVVYTTRWILKWRKTGPK